MHRIKTLGTIGLLATLIATGCDGEGQDTVGPRGGVIESADGRLVLEIPEGALDHDVAITIGRVDEGEGLPVYELEPRGTAFQFPARVTYDFSGDDEMMDNAEAVTLLVDRGEGWTRMADRDLDLGNAEISASATYLATMTVGAR